MNYHYIAFNSSLYENYGNNPAPAQTQPATRERTVELENEINRLSDKITSLEQSPSQAESGKGEKDREITQLRQRIQDKDSEIENLKRDNVYLSTQLQRLERLLSQIATLQAASQPVAKKK